MSAESKTQSVSAASPKSKLSVRYVAVSAMLAAVGFVLMLLEFPIPIMPPFIKLDVSDLPALLGAFAYGPVCGVVIALVKNMLFMIIKFAETNGVGPLCNFVLNAAFAAAAGFIYKHHKDIKGAVAGSLVGAVVMGLLSVPLNYFITYPVYAAAFGGMELIIGAYQTILPSADSLIKCLLIFNLPFTIVKGLLCALLCFLIYKPLSPVLHGRK